MVAYCEYKILEFDKLVIEVYRNEFTFDAAMAERMNVFNDINFCSGLNFLIDVRRTIYNVSYQSTKNFRDFIVSSVNAKQMNKIAILTNTPQQVAAAMFFGYAQTELINNYNVFSTLEVALQWLKIDEKRTAVISSELNQLANALHVSPNS